MYIEVMNVSKEIKGKRLLDHINLSLEEGKIYGFSGRNGSGKTIFMKTICGFMRPTEGYVMVGGKKIGADVDFPEDTGVIIETPVFLPYLTGYRNLKNLADIRHRIGRDEIMEAIRQVGLDPESRLPVGKYSLGMRQRLGLAQAIMEQPRLLVLDEPMNSLDLEGVEFFRNVFRQYREQGGTIIMSSHNPEDMDQLCDTVYHMQNGRLV